MTVNFGVPVNNSHQGYSQDLETEWPKLVFAKYLGVLIFKGHHHMFRLQPKTCIYLLKQGIISSYNVTNIIVRRRKKYMLKIDIWRNYPPKSLGVHKMPVRPAGLEYDLNHDSSTCE